MSTFSPIAQTSFANSTAYDAHRPTYPQASVQHLLEQCRVAGKRGARIIDLAAGTGKFTEALAAREEGFEILAVEPHADMRRVLSERGLKGVRVVDGTAEDVPVENGWADAVFVAQAGSGFTSYSSSSIPIRTDFNRNLVCDPMTCRSLLTHHGWKAVLLKVCAQKSLTGKSALFRLLARSSDSGPTRDL